ncbi:hypothetical protein [Lysobacter sp. A3-1-A15]|uniref:hypothetical protein n=1 Tax=Novilysobacter viscosus TaxID=3098602 RepID=UPI002ED8DB21
MSAPGTDGGTRGRMLAIVASVVVAAAVIAGIASIGLPGEQRQVRLDERRIEDLQRIVEAVELHHREHGRLPTDLAAASARPGWDLALIDPVSGEAYDYRPLQGKRFELCAVFASDSGERDGRGGNAPLEWRHGAGRHCFNREVRRAGKPGA